MIRVSTLCLGETLMPLTQEEVEALIAMEKHRADDTLYKFPGPGGEIRIPIVSANRREEFVLDIRRHKIEIVRGGKYQTRARVASPIARLCFARPHRNPDDTEISGTHLHVYRDGYELKWAYPPDSSLFPNPEDRNQLFMDFMAYVNVSRVPFIEPDLFA